MRSCVAVLLTVTGCIEVVSPEDRDWLVNLGDTGGGLAWLAGDSAILYAGGSDIRSVRPDGRDVRLVARTAGSIDCIATSTDAAFLYYVAREQAPGDTSGSATVPALYRLDLTTRQIERVTHRAQTCDRGPGSYGGRAGRPMLALGARAMGVIVLPDSLFVDDPFTTTLRFIGTGCHALLAAAPDGRRAICIAQTGVPLFTEASPPFVNQYDLVSGGITRTAGWQGNLLAALWGSDGVRFVSRTNVACGSDIPDCRQIDGATPPAVSPDRRTFATWLTWCTLVFCLDSDSRLVVIDDQARIQRVLYTLRYLVGTAAISQDGRRLAYTVNHHLYVVDL